MDHESSWISVELNGQPSRSIISLADLSIDWDAGQPQQVARLKCRRWISM